MGQVHLSLRIDATQWLNEQRQRSGQSVTAIVEALIGEAMRRGWEVQPTLAVIERGQS